MEHIKLSAEDQARELKARVESLSHSKPDFGYVDQIDYNHGDHSKRGWGFFLDVIARFRQKEKISTAITHFNDEKRKWKE